MKTLHGHGHWFNASDSTIFQQDVDGDWDGSFFYFFKTAFLSIQGAFAFMSMAYYSEQHPRAEAARAVAGVGLGFPKNHRRSMSVSGLFS